MKIEVLDCTLRDGGYVNNWLFGKNLIAKIAEKLCESQIETIECGFLSQTKSSNEDQSIFSDITAAEKSFCNCNEHLALMINCGEYDPKDIPPYTGGKISTIRIAFHKHQKESAQVLCVELRKKGYKIFFQPMVTMGYSDFELLSLIEWANEYRPEAFYMVDSFGTMRKNDLLRMFYLIDNNLNPNIKVGFHSHNNLQLSFSNAQELISLNVKRTIIIDSSVLGMGRGAGNLCTELITQYINENVESKYNLVPILEIMDEYIMPIYNLHPWGYSAPYYIAAINGCHPNYATYLINLQTLCIQDINSIIRSIPAEKRHLYDKNTIYELYTKYQQNSVDDSQVLHELKNLCKGKKILLLAPGKSLSTKRKEVTEFIEKYSPVVIGINHIPKNFKFDRIFLSNLKRFKSIDEAVSLIKEKVIFTSNITDDKNLAVVNYSSYLNENDSIVDNAGLMLVNLLRKVNVDTLYLAGYDGFSYSGANNYYDDKLINSVQFEKQQLTNIAIIEYFRKIRKMINIEFITPTIYDKGEINE